MHMRRATFDGTGMLTDVFADVSCDDGGDVGVGFESSLY